MAKADKKIILSSNPLQNCMELQIFCYILTHTYVKWHESIVFQFLAVTIVITNLLTMTSSQQIIHTCIFTDLLSWLHVVLSFQLSVDQTANLGGKENPTANMGDS